MSERAFYAPRTRKPTLWLGLLAGFAAMAVTARACGFFQWYAIPPFLGSAYLVLTYGLGLRNFQRPVLAISDHAIEHWPIPTLARRRVRAGQGVRVAKSTRRRLVLRTAGGKRIPVRLDWLSKPDRAEARAAIEQWVKRHGAAAD
ncbi:MAG: hypothetical protein OEM05_12485 [Myxococcales bacterium]|nr:hypothetical protein [Myxococcales bacterium]